MYKEGVYDWLLKHVESNEDSWLSKFLEDFVTIEEDTTDAAQPEQTPSEWNKMSSFFNL